MARNEEKAMNLWNKWTTFKRDFHLKSSNRHPLLSSECDSLVDAEKIRRDILKELTRKGTQIQNANLGEFKIRELNDEINKLMGRKFYWEKRIRELGGTDFKKGRQHVDVDGKELPGMPGYRYYGAAKDLPGVRELFAQAQEEIEQQRKRKSRKELAANITPDYYGYRDEDDGVLVEKEMHAEVTLS
jgi:pre-mRNA-splicing factor ISY1